jgi:hypothetical protein
LLLGDLDAADRSAARSILAATVNPALHLLAIGIILLLMAELLKE